MRILVVDDEKVIVKGIKFNLENDGYEVLTGSDGVEAVEIVKAQDVDLVVLDLMMPRLDGLGACQRIREFSDVPIIMLTAKAGDMDKLLGFEHGADDYLTKPFNILELKARIRALLRRSGGKKDARSTMMTCDNISLDTDARNAYNSGVLADLTVKEFDLIELLMRNPNRVYSRETLLDTIWGYDEYRSEIRTVDVHIRRLREKLERNPAEPEHIMTKWGVGYYFKE
jgi:DNA-binding response OmpR family regulator